MSLTRPRATPLPVDFGFIALLVLVVAANWLIDPMTLRNDTRATLHMFHSIYTEFFLHGELQGWDPFYYMGAATDMRLLTNLSCPLMLTAVVGKMLGVADAFTVYKWGLVLEQLALVSGVYLLGQSLYRHRRAALFAGLCAALTAVWYIQVWFNFRHYALLPLSLYLVVEFFRRQRPGLLFASGVVFVLSQLGSPGYFLPVQVLVLAVFVGVLAAVRRARGLPVLPGARAWLGAESLVWGAVLAALGAAFLIFCATFLQYDTMGGYSGRDPLTGKVTLHNYLVLLNDPTKALSSLWELVYAAPRDWIFTLYAGLFCVPFALYGFVRREDHPGEAYPATLAAMAAALGLALGQAGFLAPLAYHVFPLMDRTRYLLSHLGLVKFFFILAAGYGVDAFLTALAGDRDQDRRSVRLAALLCAGTCAAVLAVDLVHGVSGGFPYQAQVLPYAFHFLPLCLLAVFALYLATTRHARERAFAWLLGLAGADLASYAFLLLFCFLPSPLLAPPEATADPMVSERVFRQSLAEMREALLVRPYTYQPTRFPREQLAARDPLTARRMAFYDLDYADLYNFFFLDVCDHGQRAPVGHVNTGMVRLTHARLGLALDESLHRDNPWLLSALTDAGRFVGCGAPKAYLTGDVYAAGSLADAALYLAEESESFARPAIVPAAPNFAPMPKDQRSMRPTVQVCPAPGLCRPGDPASPAFWDSLYTVSPDLKRTVLYTYPRPKTVVKYRMAPASPQDAPLMPRAWTLSGSDDGQSWTVLDRRETPAWTPTGHRDFALASPATHRYFVLDVERSDTPGRFSLGRFSLLTFPDAPPPAPREPVQVENFRANSVTMRADVPEGGPRYLVYLDNADPGWRAFVDGKPAPLYLANLAFKAVRLEPGMHTVVFEYKGKGVNRQIAWGFLAVGSVFALWCLWLALALACPRVPRPQPCPAPQTLRR